MARIIIADDDPVTCHLVSSLLEKEGHQVGCLDDGTDVARIAASKLPDLLILDCVMPGKSGLEALREVRAELGYALPVMVMTGRQSRADEAIAYEAGANDYIRKPIDPDELAVRAGAMLARTPVAGCA